MIGETRAHFHSKRELIHISKYNISDKYHMGSDYFDVKHYFVNPSSFDVKGYLKGIADRGTYHKPIPFVLELYTSVNEHDLSEEDSEEVHSNLQARLEKWSNFPQPKGSGVTLLYHGQSGTTKFSFSKRTYLDLLTSLPLDRRVIGEIVSLLSSSRSLPRIFDPHQINRLSRSEENQAHKAAMYSQLVYQKVKRVTLKIDDPHNCRIELERLVEKKLEQSGMDQQLGSIERELESDEYTKPTTLDDFF